MSKKKKKKRKKDVKEQNRSLNLGFFPVSAMQVKSWPRSYVALHG